jgi:hypothetical protein
MPELALAPRSAAAGLAAEAARLAAGLADLIDGLPAAHAEALGDASTFLRRMAAVHRSALGGPDVPPLPLDRLATALGLSVAERDAVVLAGLPEEHEGYAGVLRRLHPAGLPRPTAGLAARLVGPEDPDAVRAALHGGPAVRSGLLRVAGDGPFPERSLELPPGIWAELAGIEVDPEPGAGVPVVTAGLEEWLAGDPAVAAIRALAAGEPVTVVVTAATVASAMARALALAAAAGRRALVAAPPTADAVAVRALARGAIPVLAAAPSDAGPAAAIPPGHPGPVVVCARPGDPGGGREERVLLDVRAEPLDPGARRRMWASLLPELAGAAGEIAARHPVEPVVAARVAADVRARAWLDGRLPGIDDVAASTRARSAGALPAGVTLARPAAGWDQLVLAADRLAQLRAAVARLRHQALVLDDWGFLRGRPGARGVRMLLSGPPGTGKTLSAEVLARELGVDLMVVDISRVLSKWIGETEQRLAEVFDAAEPGQAVLLFDEADALFGRRTEIADAHDRYANLETAYLLQRLDRFEGLAILTTNLRQNIDEAFTRRIEFVVEYGEPTRSEREALWRAHVPPGAPLAPDLDFAELAARYPVVGGLIRNAAVAAAFLAAGDGTPITRDHALRALEREYEKHGRAFPGRPPQPRPAHPEPQPDQNAARGNAQRSPR